VETAVNVLGVEAPFFRASIDGRRFAFFFHHFPVTRADANEHESALENKSAIDATATSSNDHVDGGLEMVRTFYDL